MGIHDGDYIMLELIETKPTTICVMEVWTKRDGIVRRFWNGVQIGEWTEEDAPIYFVSNRREAHGKDNDQRIRTR